MDLLDSGEMVQQHLFHFTIFGDHNRSIRYMAAYCSTATSCTIQVFQNQQRPVTGSIGNGLPPDGNRLLRLLKTLAPPVPAVTHLVHPEDEARRLADVEEQVAHDVRRLVVHHLQAGAEPVVTGAVHHRVELVIEQAVHRLARVDGERADEIVVPATPIGGGVPSELHRLVCPPAWTAPLGARHPHQVLWNRLLLVRSKRVPAKRWLDLYIGFRLVDVNDGVVDDGEQWDDRVLLHLRDGELPGVKLAYKKSKYYLLQ